MRVVTVRARHAGAVHPALEERAVVVHLVSLLSVGEVEARLDQGRDVVIEQRCAGRVAFRDVRAQCVALGARLDLPIGGARRTAMCGRRGRIPHPLCRVSLGELRRQPIVVPDELAEKGWVRSPARMSRAGSVTRLARHVDLRARRVEFAGRGVISLPHAGRVAIGAHEVPVVLCARPMELVGVGDNHARVEREPPLTALCRGPRVPRDRQCLNAPAGKVDQILLQWVNAERVADHVVVALAVGTLGVHDEPVAAANEGRRDAASLESRAIEAAEDRGGCRVLHGDRVLRRLPQGVLGRVTGRAPCRPDELGGRLRFA